MTNKEKFNIIYKHFAKPIADMKMTYNKVIRKTYEKYKDILKV